MKKTLKTVMHFLQRINPSTGFERPMMNTEDALNIITKSGYDAYFWLLGISHHEEKELWEALETLKKAGYIITDSHGSLVGKVAKARLSKNEKVAARRASFKLIEPK